MKLLSELRRRNVLRMAVLYAVAAWLMMQVAGVLIDLGALPVWNGPWVLTVLAIGFPIALLVSWFYEITSEGVSLENDVKPGESITHVTGRRLDFIVISMLCAAVILFAYDKWWIPAPSQQSIAVLPFENMSGDPEQEYFSDGISEELLNLLAKIPELRVISRSSAFSFKGKSIAIPEIAARLNVAHVLEGSVRRMGNRVRITAQLIEASSDSHLWSATYDRDFDDIFAVQDEISAAISDALKIELVTGAGETEPPAAIKSASADAYDAYLQGRELIRLRGEDNLWEAVRHLERSLRLDNDFAPAHAQLAIATALLSNHPDAYGRLSMEEVRQIAIPHLDRAQALEPDLAEAHQGRGLLTAFGGDPEAEIEHARKALASNPSYSDAMNSLQIALYYLGRYEESDEVLNQMMIIDPLTVAGRSNYIALLAEQGRIDEAHAAADLLVVQRPAWGYVGHAATSIRFEGEIAEGLSWALKARRNSSFVWFAFILVSEFEEARRVGGNMSHWLDFNAGRLDQAIRKTQDLLHEDPDNVEIIRTAALFLYFAGRASEALPLYERLLDLAPEGQPILSDFPLVDTMALAFVRRKSGDEEGAQAAAQLVRRDHAARRSAGRDHSGLNRARAMIAAFDHEPNGVVDELKSAFDSGLRWRGTFGNPIYEDMRQDLRFIDLQTQLDEILAVEHEKVLQLICFNNPVPDDWQPSPETCEGVVEQQVPRL